MVKPSYQGVRLSMEVHGIEASAEKMPKKCRKKKKRSCASITATSTQHKQPMQTSRNWLFTFNNPNGLIDVDLQSHVRWYIYQHEVGENGTEHFQGYVQLDRAQRLSFVRHILPEAHWEMRRGTHQQAKEYCSKAETRLDGPWEWGDEISVQGERNDILAFKQDLDSGATDVELWDRHPGCYLRYERMVGKIRLLKGIEKARSEKTVVTVLYGRPGTGKTSHVRNQAPNAFWKSPNNNWWDGYQGEEDVVLDDYKSWLPWSELLQVMDGTPLRVQIKGGFVNFVAKRLWITTNFLPKEWYDKAIEFPDRYPMQAIYRRVNRWMIFLETPEFSENPSLENVEVLTFDATDNNNTNEDGWKRFIL